jgi:predicted transcriptional regulator
MIEGFCTSTAKDVFIELFCDIVHKNSRKNIPHFEVGDWPTFDMKQWTKNPVAVVGTLRGTEKIIWECQKRGHPFYYMDHAYFHATRNYKSGPHGVLYRIVKSQMQMNTIVELDKEDLKRISRFKPVETKPFNGGGEHILICPPTTAICRLYELGDEQMWIDSTITELTKYTDRNIIVRKKDTKKPLIQDLKNCHAVVSHQSTAAIEAILNGVPSFCDAVSAAREVSECLLENIESPYFPNDDLLKQWIDSLLACQFDTDEIKNGTARAMVDKLQ